MAENGISLTLDDIDIPIITLDTAVVGSGCAGWNAIDWLARLGRRDTALVTEDINAGTSRNTGSDKQTYYKLSLASDTPDSVADMARDLFAGGCVNGDSAYAEAAGSARCFMKLVNLGVPFPSNEYGEFVGYKTDHDPRQRATSAGPLTSRFMTERLEASARDQGARVLDGFTAVRLLTRDGAVEGLICIDRSFADSPSMGLTILRARHVILATGGPAAIYRDSVYPESQTGMTGMALEAGALGVNLHSWQYGLASVQFRWNVSGTYQQVLPRYISVDSAGVGHEFLLDYYDSPAHALDAVFLKGYQWPFDSAKIGGSSLIDLIVHHERFDLGRRVFLDYRSNPTGLDEGYASIGEEARRYLTNSGAVQPLPVERLAHMNAPAIELYRSHGIDLYHEPLEIAVCAQHHNGGLLVDKNWQTNIKGLYVAGECAGTFGMRRPGGSALNSTQVGSLRAAEHIANEPAEDISVTDAFKRLAAAEAARLIDTLRLGVTESSDDTAALMSRYAAHLRDSERMREILAGQGIPLSTAAAGTSPCRQLSAAAQREGNHPAAAAAPLLWRGMGQERRSSAESTLPISPPQRRSYPYSPPQEGGTAAAVGWFPSHGNESRFPHRGPPTALLKSRDASITTAAVLSSMLAAAEYGSQGGSLTLSADGTPAHPKLQGYNFRPAAQSINDSQIITKIEAGACVSYAAPVRPLPSPDSWFENVWKEYRERRGL